MVMSLILGVSCSWANEFPDWVRVEVSRAAVRHGVSPPVADAIAYVESGFNPRARSPKGAIGVMQLMPATAAGLRVNPYSAWENIDGGVRYFKWLVERYRGDIRLAVAAYNAGPVVVDHFGGVPPYAQTRDYIGRVSAAMSGQRLARQRRKEVSYFRPRRSRCYPSEIAIDGGGQVYIRARPMPRGCEPAE